MTRNAIESVKWFYGSISSPNSSSHATAVNWYSKFERTWSHIEWFGKVGLMYPSDYIYATAGGTTTDRASCLAVSNNKWYNSVSDCKKNDYLNRSTFQWVLLLIMQMIAMLLPYINMGEYIVMVQ